MGARGPKGEQSENVTKMSLVIHERPKPPKKLPKIARELWKQIVDSKPVDHFQRAELPLLVKYCMAEHFYWQAVELMSEDMVITTAKGYSLPDTYMTIAQNQVKIQNALATKLRIAVNSRISNHKGAGEKEPPIPKRERKGLMFGGNNPK